MRKEDLVLVIDMQNVYRAGQKWACRDFDGAAARIVDTAAAADRADAELIVTAFLPPAFPEGDWRHYNTKYAAINADPWLNALADEIAPLAETHPYFPKSTYNALDHPDVRAAALRARDCGGRVVLTGVVAECCVLWTACAAIDLGCHVLYLTDAVSGLDRPKEAAAELVLSGLAPLQCELMTTAEYLSEGLSENKETMG